LLEASFFNRVTVDQEMKLWRDTVIQPLRQLRRQLKQQPVAQVQSLRQQVLQAEISAERVYQDKLLERLLLAAAEPVLGAACAYRNLASYWQGLDLGAPVWDDVRPLLQAVYPEDDISLLVGELRRG
jgi:hypothetical protein